MALQLKKYKSLINSKQSKLGIIEADLQERKRVVDKKQAVFNDQIQMRHKCEKDTLCRMKAQAK